MPKFRRQRTSWLRACEVVEVEYPTSTVKHYGVAEFPTIEPQDDDRLHVVTDTDRLDRLANDNYGDPRLWWVIAVANGWDMAATSLSAGQEILIPSPRYVRRRLVG